MATMPKAFFRGAATTNLETVLYTVPENSICVVTNIVVVNTSASEQTFTLYLAGDRIHAATKLAANSSAYIDLKQVITENLTIAGGASATSITFHISGVEIV
jgi:DeoR/GlpR family transcriptional regulator of sugar metabolism